MKTDRFGKLLAAGIVAGLFYVGSAVFALAGGRVSPTAQAQIMAPSLTQEHDDVLITTSADGKTLYLWTFGHRQLLDANRVPVFQGEVCPD